MRQHTAFLVVAALFAAFTLISNLHAQPLVTIETVTVGDPGNVADTTGYGAVAYEFNIGKYEVTIGQYTTFLNSVASVTSDSYVVNLWNTGMTTDLNVGGISRSGSGTELNPYSYSGIGSGNRPIAYVSWFDAARFANWMNNGATNGASTETGAYTLNGATSGIFLKNAAAAWWIPSEDEWYKSAYYKTGGLSAGYWQYPTTADTPPTQEPNPPGSSNSANYGLRPNGDKLTEVGAYITSPSPSGTFDQGGNIYEWNDAVINDPTGELRGLRGGSWDSGTFMQLNSSVRGGSVPEMNGELSYVGFRVATVPEPSAYALLVMTGAGALWWARRRR